MPRTFVGLPDEQVWKLLAYVRSLYKGDPSLINWALTPPRGRPRRMIAEFAQPQGLSRRRRACRTMEVPTPSDNPITPGKIKLGEQLFFDKRLSKGKTMSCETCHVPEKGWTDGQPFSKKFDGTLNTRHTPTLFGVGFYPELYWDGRAQGLEALIPDVMKSQMGADPDEVAKELGSGPGLQVGLRGGAGRTAHGRPHRQGPGHVRADHPRRRHPLRQPSGRVEDSEAAKGFKVFSEVTHCTLCHLPPLFSDTLFHNMGVGSDRENPDPGRDKVLVDTAAAAGTPRSARGGGLDGSLQDRQPARPAAHGPRTSTMAARRRYDEAAGIMMKGGIPNPHLDEKLKAWPVTPEQRTQLLAFLRSLTPESQAVPAPRGPLRPPA